MLGSPAYKLIIAAARTKQFSILYKFRSVECVRETVAFLGTSRRLKLILVGKVRGREDRCFILRIPVWAKDRLRKQIRGSTAATL